LNINKLKQLVGLLEDSDVAEIEVKCLFSRIRVSKSNSGAIAPLFSGQVMAPAAAPFPAAAPALPSEAAPAEGADAETALEDPSILRITSPMVGTFYRAPSPDSSNFVEEGHAVSKGAVVCIVEAMKVMNEIESEYDGAIMKIHVANGEPVEYGQVLFSVKPN
jgi:acetyl-CoA carboxylase biotin carboxyl carrier protein